MVETRCHRKKEAKYFCSLDPASGFYQIPISERSSYLCTMETQKGRYRFLRLPFGLICPQGVLAGYVRVFWWSTGSVYLLWWLLSDGWHKRRTRNLRRVLVRCHELNLKLNLEKCRFFFAVATLVRTCYCSRSSESWSQESRSHSEHARTNG